MDYRECWFCYVLRLCQTEGNITLDDLIRYTTQAELKMNHNANIERNRAVYISFIQLGPESSWSTLCKLHSINRSQARTIVRNMYTHMRPYVHKMYIAQLPDDPGNPLTLEKYVGAELVRALQDSGIASLSDAAVNCKQEGYPAIYDGGVPFIDMVQLKVCAACYAAHGGCATGKYNASAVALCREFSREDMTPETLAKVILSEDFDHSAYAKFNTRTLYSVCTRLEGQKRKYKNRADAISTIFQLVIRTSIS